MIQMIYSSPLLSELEMLKKDMEENNQDLVISVFGFEGSGKSTFAVNLDKVLDPSFCADNLQKRVARSIEDFARKVYLTGPMQVMHWDEAHRFASRGTFDSQMNRDLLEYFQDIRGAKRIFVLCYPDLREMDRYITKHRTKLFFETVKTGNNFWVRGWRKDQILAMLDTMRLYKGKSKKDRWKGIPRKPILVFRCDYKGIEAEMQEYAKLKAASLKNADEVLKAKYGNYNLMDLVREVQQVTDYHESHIRLTASDVVQKAAKNGWKDHIKIQNNRYTITDDSVFENLVKDTLARLPRAEISEISESTTKDIQGEVMP